jgi:hypothetical protein
MDTWLVSEGDDGLYSRGKLLARGSLLEIANIGTYAGK